MCSRASSPPTSTSGCTQRSRRAATFASRSSTPSTGALPGACLRVRLRRDRHRSSATKPFHAWTNGQVERLNRTFNEVTVRSYQHESHDQLRDYVAAFVGAHNFAKRVKALAGLTPFEAICKAWTKEPQRFRLCPTISRRD
ncbi:integrase core domain-containing protein [Bradyrhizobium sp. CCH5-F6]|uniref:integrase core domain-containing protein n=1 Tax=Bradyrhizobium sp. CCH5-F6 TaxID=1768753 RepID=UPI001203D4C5|nr:MAG: transposase [Bradyrhizobium icense]